MTVKTRSQREQRTTGIRNMTSQVKDAPVVIGVAGGTGCGKSSLAKRIIDGLGEDNDLDCIASETHLH